MSDVLDNLRDWSAASRPSERGAIDNAIEEIIALRSRLNEALERDRKGDQIIIELTLDRDSLARRLDAVGKLVESDHATSDCSTCHELYRLLVERQK